MEPYQKKPPPDAPAAASQNKNVLLLNRKFMKKFISQLRDRQTQRKNELSQKEVEFIASLSNDKSWMDETVMFIRLFIWATALYCGYTGYIFYQSSFAATFGETMSMLIAFVLMACVEIGKIGILPKVFRAVAFGWYDGSIASSAYWGFLGIIGFGFVYWSYTVSTDGGKMKADQMEREHTEQTTVPLPQRIAEACATIDAQIESANTNYNTAMGTKWKGVTTYESQKSAKKIQEQISSLQAQRQQVVQQVTNGFGTEMGAKTGESNAFAAFIRRFGGWFEALAVVAMLAVTFFEMRLVELHQEQQQQQQQPANNNGQQQQQPGAGAYRPAQVNGFSNGLPQNNAYSNLGTQAFGASRPQIGFNINRNTGNVPPATGTAHTPPIDSVPQCDTDTDAQKTEWADSALREAISRVRKDLANLRNENGLKGSVVARIRRAMFDTRDWFKNPGFTPSHEAAAAAGACFMEAAEELYQQGYFTDISDILKALQTEPVISA